MRHGIKIFFFLFSLTFLSGCASLPTSTKKPKLHTIAFYNTEKLYDTENDPKTDDDGFTPNGIMKWDKIRYNAKIKQIASVIETIGGKNGPAVIGLSDIENRKVLEDLVNASPLRKRRYKIIHYDSPDPEGLDVALLYNPKVFKPTAHTNISIKFSEKGFSSRDILQVQGTLQGEPVTFYVNHWPEDKGSAALGNSRRREAATELRRQIDLQKKSDKNTKIIVLGDFSDEPKSATMERIVKATGRPNPAYQEELFNTFYLWYVQGRGSFHTRNDNKMYDQILISKSLVGTGNGLHYVHGSAQIHDPEFTKYTFGRYKDTPRQTWSGTLYIGGYSDHFPVYIKLQQ
ncbi:endonuclease/exonuclease/phosphatase family protein [Pontibacter sp. JH31]|uniref:Endonuclease/exonuclease/phosphatase family protein n=1 Tax=Pontibacter aquaedesilientis TaxID=2766980 RepID=A0ABR7XH70_9BACT|nr:endonuclease/exonuclease/phosphatase family protein [Pontibacter aquaedesilientis]MBD1397654.1 endonuclease/exonuclease/phosphatase family protein [Pontibacter aquaedesilientis]